MRLISAVISVYLLKIKIQTFCRLILKHTHTDQGWFVSLTWLGQQGGAYQAVREDSGVVRHGDDAQGTLGRSTRSGAGGKRETEVKIRGTAL